MKINWDEGTSTLIAHALPVIRVIKSDRGKLGRIVALAPSKGQGEQQANSIA